jgi:hypothetical protein
MIELNLHPSIRELRVFGLSGTGLLGAISAVLTARNNPADGLDTAVTALATVLAAIAVYAITLVRPDILRLPFVALSLVTWPIGWLISHLILVVVFYGLITPLGLALRLAGRDALGRRFDRTASTYWQPRQSRPDVERYWRRY